ncbi:hypothetical protein PV394_15030 [Streptomyces sp. NE06-03E]|uniref:hypothetical protein n=1 Tax=Streptomyces sp. NE06-03E TaxID=3028695 RepID=UPI0029BA0449|nr:hypothetical protein [Streptomyces sp. NE06-03E]MDX3056439.1 hypothetical protein [Streptomyces sp. NE06-03E]
MSDVLPLLVLAGALAAVLGFFRWLASRVRRRGTAGAAVTAALASYDEAFRVTAQAERKAPLLSPDRPWETGRRGTPLSGAHPRRRGPGLRRRAGRLWRGRRA